MRAWSCCDCLWHHPQVDLHAITSRKEAGMQVADVFPSLRGRIDLAFQRPEDAGLERCEAVFFATPNGVAMQQARIPACCRDPNHRPGRRLPAPGHRRCGRSGTACRTLARSWSPRRCTGLPEVNREAIRSRASGGQSGLLPDRGALRLPAPGRVRRGRPRPPDRRRKVWRQRGRSKGGNAYSFLGGCR